MKKMAYFGVIVLGTMVACHGASDKKREEKMHAGTIAAHEIKEIDSAKLIIPGERAGKLYLGQDMQAVVKLLGQADDGDAAMGSALGIWYTKSSADVNLRNPVAVFSSYKDSTMVAKTVKQFSVSAPEFSTTEGIHTGLKLSQLMAAYPALKETGVYAKGRDTLKVYDNQVEGIAFDLVQDTCSAITIHPKGKPANSTYLDVHPGWTVVSRQ
jgi:hypothetical protein